MINIWIAPADNGPHRAFGFGLRVNPQTHVVDTSIESKMGDHGSEVKVTEANTRVVMDAIFNGNEQYATQAGSLDIVDAFRLGIATQTDLGAELYTVEVAEKRFSVPPGRHFDLKVRVLDRTHPGGKPSKLDITLQRMFVREDYEPDGIAPEDSAIFGGTLELGLTLETGADDSIVQATRQSTVRLNNEPAIVAMRVKLDGQPAQPAWQMMAVMSNEVASDEIPEGLRAKLYPDGSIALGDLAFFLRLVTEPIRLADTRI